MRLAKSLACVLGFVFAAPVVAQDFRSPEVHPDGSVTVRLRSGSAQSVTCSLGAVRVEMSKGDGNVWEGKFSSLPPGIHDYSFNVDGTRIIDPSNRNVKKWFTLASMVEVPGTVPRLTEFQDVAHGTVQKLIYRSESVGIARPVIVYTPPGYESSDDDYPFLLLMHGFGDDETAWTEVGRANLIADNLIASGRIRPTIIAMPYGHPVPPPFGPRSRRPDNYFVENSNVYETDVMNDLMPFLESRFRISSNADHRGVAGLSMGGGHAFMIGLRNTEVFKHVGAFSAAAPQVNKENLRESLPAIYGDQPKANSLRQLWIPIGRDDFLLQRNNSFCKLLTANGVNHEYAITEGAHSWYVWRKYLPAFLEMSFPAKQ